MIRAVIFDFGGVLMRTVDQTGRRVWEGRLGLEPGGLERVVHGSDVWIEAQRGSLTPEAYWQAVAERLNVPPEDLPALREDYFRGDQLDEALTALIEQLRGEGYKVGLLSNDAPTLEAKLRDQLEIYDYFDSVIISGRDGMMKPEPAAFQAAAKALGYSVPECLFIDDNTANVDGARAVGMHAILYRTGMDVEAAIRPILDDDSQRTCALIFDYGNVLDIPPDWDAWRVQRDEVAAPFNMSGETLWLLIYQSEAWNQVKIGEITYDEYLDTLFKPLGLESNADQRSLMDALMRGREGIDPDMRALLLRLKAARTPDAPEGYKLALLSNAHQRSAEMWMEAVGLAGVFDVLVSSAEVGLAKPDPAIYRLTLERLGIAPGAGLFIDDMTRNINAAESVGLPCITFESAAQLIQELAKRKIL